MSGSDSVNPNAESCTAWRAALLAAASGEEQVPAGLAAHLAACAGCREEFAAVRELSDALRPALLPQSLPPQLVRRIRARLAAAARRPARGLLGVLGMAGAAAAVALVVLGSWSVGVRNAGSLSIAPLDANDAAAVAEAYALLEWETEQAWVSRLARDVRQTTETFDSDAERRLPWDEREDWDMPVSRESGGVAPLAAEFASLPHRRLDRCG